MGSLRFFLAFLVMISHVNTHWIYFNPGMFALPGFYIISGYAMTAVIRSHYPVPKKISWFYLDRVLRLYPQYLLFVFFTVLMISVFGIMDPYYSNLPPKSVNIPLIDILLNLLIIPNNLIFFRSHFSDFALIIPPAWSLGLEMIFYLSFPFILLYNLRKIAFIGSSVIFLFAINSVINPMTFGYSTLPGTLLFFLIGSLIYDTKESVTSRIPVYCFWAGLIILIFLFFTDGYKIAANLETVIALIIVPFIVFLVKNYRSKNDDFLGNISYGLFLVHYIVIHFFTTVFPSISGLLLYLLVISTTILLAIIGFKVVEAPVVKFRRQFRTYS